MIFAEGMQVIYKDHVGYISFVCDYSVSICVCRGVTRAHDVNIVVYRSQFKDIRLFKESDK